MKSEVRSDSRLFRTLARELLDQGIGMRFRAEGRSMFPAIKDGDLVEVQPQAKHAAGDVVLVSNEEGMRAHRVVRTSEDCVVTRGDSCSEDDLATPASSVVGRLSSVVADDRRRSPHTWRTRVRQLLSRLR